MPAGQFSMFKVKSDALGQGALENGFMLVLLQCGTVLGKHAVVLQPARAPPTLRARAYTVSGRLRAKGASGTCWWKRRSGRERTNQLYLAQWPGQPEP